MFSIEPEMFEPDKLSRLSCIYSNPTGLGNKIADLEIIVAELDPDLMFFCETWFSNESQIHMEKYQGYYRNRLNSKTTKTYYSRGGVCIYGKDNLDITEITDNVLSHKDL